MDKLCEDFACEVLLPGLNRDFVIGMLQNDHTLRHMVETYTEMCIRQLELDNLRVNGDDGHMKKD